MSIHSMTGFANASGECGNKRINLELRAVNHRYLDVQFKMPDDLRHLESIMREAVAAKAARGKVECRIQVQTLEAGSVGKLSINQELVHQLAYLNKKWRKQHSDLGKLSVADILKFPGVLTTQGEDEEAFAQTVQKLLSKALQDFGAARAREGEKLQQHLLERLDAMEKIIASLQEVFPNLVEAHLEKVRTRLKEAVDNIDDNRLQQEFALFMQKADVDEEFSRLRTHITEVRRIVRESKNAAGKRLDFLMQELNREANTLGSKAIAAECTQASVELKVLIEQMREQVQNIE
ncbi:YicC/YloC family endoribonuclease [Neisseria arctica]|nr:YicC/YloC family endoribonuclease [Neisseria arctica]UOO86411.1 YicC family protein [Neisseria arctica]